MLNQQRTLKVLLEEVVDKGNHFIHLNMVIKKIMFHQIKLLK